ncbi:MAG: ArsR/SmtB family transcription factor [Eubacteriales bacterium]
MKLIIQDIYKYEVIAQALSNKTRLKIIDLLYNHDYNINEISKKLNMPVPTVTVNIQKLEESGIVECHAKSGKHGKQKVCKLKYDEILLQFREEPQDNKVEHLTVIKDSPANYTEIIEESIDIPLNDYIDCKVTPDCGLASYHKFIGKSNHPDAFLSPERSKAQILWFNDGYIQYQLDIDSTNCIYESLSISFEACSEHLFFNRNWPSDITLWINDHELGTHTSDGYFGEPMNRNPSWWPSDKSQGGELITFEIDQNATYINGNLIQSLKLKDIFDKDDRMISIKIGIKEDAKNCRGIIIFGKDYGFYDQNILLSIHYRKKIN